MVTVTLSGQFFQAQSPKGLSSRKKTCGLAARRHSRPIWRKVGVGRQWQKCPTVTCAVSTWPKISVPKQKRVHTNFGTSCALVCLVSLGRTTFLKKKRGFLSKGEGRNIIQGTNVLKAFQCKDLYVGTDPLPWRDYPGAPFWHQRRVNEDVLLANILFLLSLVMGRVAH